MAFGLHECVSDVIQV